MSSSSSAAGGAQDRWPWPAPPLDWPHVAPARVPGPVACRVETIDGAAADAFAGDIDPDARAWPISARAAGPFVELPLARIRRVTLAAPLRAALRSLDLGPASVPVAAHEREFRCFDSHGIVRLSGRTVGHVRRASGLFLFRVTEDQRGLHRVFVPVSAYERVEFGPTSQERVEDPFIADPASLWRAVDARLGRVPRLGEVLVRLGLVDERQIERALAARDDPRPLGERLVRDGLLSADQLAMAIAVKLGMPLVDLRRFPVDAACARRLPLDVSRRHCAIPIASDGRRVAVAMDQPARVAALEAARVLPGMQMVPVIAAEGQIRLALAASREEDGWG